MHIQKVTFFFYWLLLIKQLYLCRRVEGSLKAAVFCTAFENNCCPYTHIQNYFLILSDLFLDILALKLLNLISHTLFKLYSNRRHIEDKSCSWHQAYGNKIELWQSKATEILTQRCRCYCYCTTTHTYVVLLCGVITDSCQYSLSGLYCINVAHVRGTVAVGGGEL